MWFSKKIKFETRRCAPGFSLPEAVAAVTILALFCSGVFTVINRCVAAAADSTMRMQAFDVARDNMERLLSQSSVEVTVEYGESEINPGIQWQTTVETFIVPTTSKTWIRAVCFAEYTDTEGELQKVELTHWITELTEAQLLELMKSRQGDDFADQIIETIEEAAEYADVDVETIEQWIENGMMLTSDGQFIKSELELYENTGGNPTWEDRRIHEEEQNKIRQKKEEIEDLLDGSDQEGETGTPYDPDVWGDYTFEELSKMPFDELWKILNSKEE